MTSKTLKTLKSSRIFHQNGFKMLDSPSLSIVSSDFSAEEKARPKIELDSDVS